MPHRLTGRLQAATLVGSIAVLAIFGGGIASASTRPVTWVGSWSASPARPGALSGAVPFYDGTGGRTVRDLFHLTLGGGEVRTRLSNVFGTRTASFTDVRVAIAAGGA